MAYSDKVIDHYSNPRNVGTLDKSKKNVGGTLGINYELKIMDYELLLMVHSDSDF